MSTPISEFTDFYNGTGSAIYSGPEEFVNDAAKQCYWVGEMLSGDGAVNNIQAGRDIADYIILDRNKTARMYNPNVTISPVATNNQTRMVVPWRFLVNYMTFTDQEIELQGSAEHMTSMGRAQIYKNVKRSKEIGMFTDTWGLLEELAWGVPDKSTMEDVDALQPAPYSLVALNNEYGAASCARFPNGAWTTRQGIAIGKANWLNKTSQYNSASVAANANNILSAMDNMWWKMQWKAPRNAAEWSTRSDLKKKRITASTAGCQIYQRLLRDSQDLFAASNRQDPAYTSPVYAGLPIERVTELDTLAMYDTGSALTTEGLAAATNSGPRFYWWDLDMLKCVVHKSRYFKKHPLQSWLGQPFTQVGYVDIWFQFYARSLARHGVVFPSGDIYNSDVIGNYPT